MKIEKIMDKDELINRKAKCEGMAEAYKGYSFLGLGVPFMEEEKKKEAERREKNMENIRNEREKRLHFKYLQTRQ
jgi:hypothetical protein